MTKQEMIAVKKFIKKNHPGITAEELTDEFLLEQIKLYRIHELSKSLAQELLKNSK
jgi:hypothetical protein